MWKTAKLVGGVVSCAVAAQDWIGYVARVEGVSMQPTLNPNPSKPDYVLLSRWYKLERGEVVALISPKDPSQKLVKRILALEGDTINLKGTWIGRERVKIPQGHCWVEGDHSENSWDSKSFGPVSVGLVTGRISVVIWPPSRWQVLEPLVPASISTKISGI